MKFKIASALFVILGMTAALAYAPPAHAKGKPAAEKSVKTKSWPSKPPKAEKGQKAKKQK